jgi:6-phosphogluconolactonase
MTDAAAARGTAPRTVISAAPATLAPILREAFGRAVLAAVADRGRCTVAIPGGSMADLLLPAVARLDAPWDRVTWLFVDERVVAPSDPESNIGRAQRLLGDALARTHATWIDASDGDVARYATAVRAAAGTPPVIDLVVLGVGEDGHVASIFPGYTAPERDDDWVSRIVDAPKMPRHRITLTMQALHGAREVWLGAFGASKREIVHALRTQANDRLPVQRLLAGVSRVTLWTDR